MEIPPGLRTQFTTSITDLGMGGFDFEIETRCLALLNGVEADAVARDTTTNPIFAKMLDRWAESKGSEWLARHIVNVQRQLAFELAIKKLSTVL